MKVCTFKTDKSGAAEVEVKTAKPKAQPQPKPPSGN